MDAHPTFQIDGNFGGTAGVAETLVQSHGGEIRLLPALPSAWLNGSVRGLRTRGGIEVDIEWREGSLGTVMLRARSGTTCRLVYGETHRNLDLEPRQEFRLNGDLDVSLMRR